nr:hypothetical protein [Veillonella denticariosi]
MTTVKIALLGFGTVAQGTFNLLQTNAAIIKDRTSVDIDIAKIFVRNPDKYSNITLPVATKYVTDIKDIIEDDSIQIVVELMGGHNLCQGLCRGGS